MLVQMIITLQQLNLVIAMEDHTFLMYNNKLLISNQADNHLLYVGTVKEQVLVIIVAVQEDMHLIRSGLVIVAERVMEQEDVLLVMDEEQYRK